MEFKYVKIVKKYGNMEFAKKLDTYGMSIRDIYGSVHFERYELTKRNAQLL